MKRGALASELPLPYFQDELARIKNMVGEVKCETSHFSRVTSLKALLTVTIGPPENTILPDLIQLAFATVPQLFQYLRDSRWESRDPA